MAPSNVLPIAWRSRVIRASSNAAMVTACVLSGRWLREVAAAGFEAGVREGRGASISGQRAILHTVAFVSSTKVV
jgi:hypothetical protein